MRRWLPYIGCFEAVTASPRDCESDAEGWAIVLRWGRLQIEFIAGWGRR